MKRLQAGETVCCTLPNGDMATDRPVYFLSGGGKITAKTYEWLKEGRVRPVSPGLFPDVEPQEWALT